MTWLQAHLALLGVALLITALAPYPWYWASTPVVVAGLWAIDRWYRR